MAALSRQQCPVCRGRKEIEPGPITNVRDIVIKASGPLASIYSCPYCNFFVKVPKGVPGVGRGYGLASGSTAQSEVVAHIKREHADKLSKGEYR